MGGRFLPTVCDASNGLHGSNAVPTSIAQTTAAPVIAARSALQQIEVTTPDTTIRSEVRSFTDPDQPAEGDTVTPAELLLIAVAARASV